MRSTSPLSFAVVAAATILTATSAPAVQTVTHCSDTCTTNCELSGDLQCCPRGANAACDGEGPITLTNGSDFDLNGHTIECQGDGVNAGSACDYDAITMSSTSSVVKNSAGTEAKIIGLFEGGVDCELKGSSRVTGIRFEGLDTKGHTSHYGVAQCAVVDHNVFFGNHDGSSNGGAAIYSTGIANSDEIYDNTSRTSSPAS